MIWYSKEYSVPLCHRFPDKIFVFGDNLVGQGRGGQAVIRGCPNSFGVPTKRLPHLLDSAFFSDSPPEKDAVVQALRKLYKIHLTQDIVFPYDGIGTGRARMKHWSPGIYHEMCTILEQHFGIRNGYGSDQALIESQL